MAENLISGYIDINQMTSIYPSSNSEKKSF